jgi:hypothetical protein
MPNSSSWKKEDITLRSIGRENSVAPFSPFCDAKHCDKFSRFSASPAQIPRWDEALWAILKYIT